MSVTDPSQHDIELSTAYHLQIPPRFYLVPGSAFIIGAAIGLRRGGRGAALRFLAENVHRPPTTVQGWYFYNKTKNYKVLLGGLKGAGRESSKLAAVALGWVGIEEGMDRIGWGNVSEVGAALGTAGVFSALCGWTIIHSIACDIMYVADRLPWKSTRRTVLLGLAIGSTLTVLRWSRGMLEAQAAVLSKQAPADKEKE